MKAKFVNEKFVEESDPIKDMGIGIPPEILKLQNELQDKIKQRAQLKSEKEDLNYQHRSEMIRQNNRDSLQRSYIEANRIRYNMRQIEDELYSIDYLISELITKIGPKYYDKKDLLFQKK